MRTTSALYKQLRSLPGSHYKVKVVCGLNEYGMDVLKSVKISNDLFLNNGLSIGNACSSECDISLIEDPANWPRMAQFEVKIQLLSEDETQYSEWLSMGSFYTDQRSYESGTLNIIGYDLMLLTEQSWSDKITPPASWPVTAKAWCDMIQAAGLFTFDSRSHLDNTIPFIGLNTTSTIRDVLKDIAAAHGKNWTVTPEGKLRLIPFTNTVVTDCAIAGIAVAGRAVVGRSDITEYYNFLDIGLNMKRFNSSTVFPAVTGVSLQTEEGYESYSGNSTGYEVTGVCNFMNRNDIADIALNSLGGYEYRPFNAESAYIDPVAELGDIIEVNSVNYQIMSIAWNLSNVPVANLSAAYEEEIDHEYVMESSVAKTYQKLVKDSAVYNLIPFPYFASSSYSGYGITWTINDDGSITVDGTVSGLSPGHYLWIRLTNPAVGKQIFLGPGVYTASCNDTNNNIWLEVEHAYEQGGSTYYKKYARTYYGPVTFEVTDEDNDVYYALCFNEGAVVDNVTFYPMVEAGPIAHAWVSPAESYRSLIQQNANQILLKVSQGDVASELSVECVSGVGYVNVGTDRFTIDSTNFKLDRNGNVTALGTMTTKSVDYETSMEAGRVKYYATINGNKEYLGLIYGGEINWYTDGVYVGATKGLLLQTKRMGGTGNIIALNAKSAGSDDFTSVICNAGANVDLPNTVPDVPFSVYGHAFFDGNVNTSGIFFYSGVSDFIAGNKNIGIYGVGGYLPNQQSGNGRYVYIFGDGLGVGGSLYVWGAKNRVVETKHFGERSLSAVESADCLFTDVGNGLIDESGVCYVYFDPVFAEAVNLDTDYFVFTTQTSLGGIQWIDKQNGYFIVHGISGTTFDWMIQAKQLGYEGNRLDLVIMDKEEPEEEDSPIPLEERYAEANATMEYMSELETDYDELANQYLNQFEEEIEDYVY